MSNPMNPSGLMLETSFGYGQLELRLNAFVAAAAAGYDLIERGTGRRISFETSPSMPNPVQETTGELSTGNGPKDGAHGGDQTSGFQEGAAGPREQKAPANAPKLEQPAVVSVPPPAVDHSAHPAGAAEAAGQAAHPSAPARLKRALTPKQRKG